MKKRVLLLILVLAAFLRLFKLGEVPVSLFGDEVDVGYHAYSILKTGRDYSGNFMPLHLHSLAEWRTPLYLYSAVPTVAIWGVTPLGVRLPAAIFGILGVWVFYLLSKKIFRDEKIAALSALLLAINPWHIQYSRGAFEVTQLILFLLAGIYFFLTARKEGKYLWLSMVFLAFTPWIYSTAKLFLPFLLLFLFFFWKKEILSLSRKYLVWAVVALAIVGGPIAYSTLFGGGTQRFNYISIISDPTTEPEVGADRLRDARMRGDLGEGLQPTLTDRILHNKFTFWEDGISDNYLKAFSTDFLFVDGDPNPRHSVNGVGQFYKIEVVALVLGLTLFFTSFKRKRIKWLIAFWILTGVLPASITRNGADHATRLIIILPPLVLLMSYGLINGFKLVGKKWKKFALALYALPFLFYFVSYLHNYYVHYPWDSERWWHAGYGEAIKSVKEIDEDYNRIFISMTGEPAWIFFAGHYMYPPSEWHKEFPVGNDVEVEGFGKISHTGKFYFGSPNTGDGIYSLSNYLQEDDLYLAVAKEMGANLIMEPERKPAGLKLLKAIAYPSGEPAMYIFAKE